MVAKDKIIFYLLFRPWELRMHLGFVIACVNDTFMLLLANWLKGTFPFLLCLSSCDSSPAARGAGTLIPSAQRLVWAAKQPLGNAALGALFA